MALEPQKASTNKENAAAEEKQNQTKEHQAGAQTKAKEKAKEQTKIGKTARAQHQAQPEDEPQGLNETQAPAQPGAGNAVRERRMADEFALRWSPEALAAASRSADYMRLVGEEAYARIHFAEAVLCGAVLIVPIGRVGRLETFDRWWAPFRVEDQWFVLRYHDTYIREYELLPANGPAPSGDGDEPRRRRQQRRDPPPRIGPRPRARRNPNDAQGAARAATARKQPRRTEKAGKKRKKKRNDVKRSVNKLYDFVARVGVELELRLEEATQNLRQQWREIRPQLLRSFVRMLGECGNVATLFLDGVASFVQLPRHIQRLASSLQSRLTVAPASETQTETFGPRGRLETSDAGHRVSRRLKLYSWNWDEPPIPWAEYIFGVDWTRDIFGVPEEERAFT